MNAVQLEYIRKSTQKLYDHPLSVIFRSPVNPELDGATDYFKIIKKPMDLGTILENIQQNKYKDASEWKNDINLVWENAMTYNLNDSIYYTCAHKIAEISKKYTERIPKTEFDLWILKISNKQAKMAELLNKAPRESIVHAIPNNNL